MSFFMYPVLNEKPNYDWIADMLEDWKNSGKHYLEFSFSWFKPHTLPSNLDEVFWMYLYNTKGKAADEDLRGVVKYRVRVVQHSPTVIKDNSIHVSYEDNPDATMWFKCDLAEELRNKSGGLTIGDDFEHTEGKNLFPAIRNSIAPVKLKATSSLVVVGTTGNYQIA